MAVGGVILNLSPASQTALPGDNISLDLIISGLNAGGAPSLGDFDLDIAFDTTKLSFISYSLSSFLGVISSTEADNFSSGVLGGLINLAEVSYLSPANLDSLQGSVFTLATLLFHVDVLGNGASTNVSFYKINALGDGFGNPFDIDAANNATVSNNVPEPSSALLILLGLSGLSWLRLRKVKRPQWPHHI
ncbi:cohesin domain-containing protein [Candidatus Nitrotoga sp. HW29]|uniref:cohesin domain-containing protein n=1 Tax=Candidatus Nitrotoga sp. HW29 TaxID=2886963 RepID=UPI001EF18753|nr:cohesin domain-containing protein [Candidatus Nitrotoga sp. HW29]